MSRLTYAIITPVRDEAENLPRLAGSIATQTLRPTIWVIVDTGSIEAGSQPHVTLGYIPRTHSSPTPLTEIMPLCIDSVSVAAGLSRVMFELQDSYLDNTPSMQPYYAAREIEALYKAGRVLSGKNLQALQDAHAMMGRATVGTILRGSCRRRPPTLPHFMR